MKFCTAIEDHFRWFEQLINDKPKSVTIATFGLYGGITFVGEDTKNWGEKYQLKTRKILDNLVDTDQVDIIVGIAPYNSCADKEVCIDCEKNYCKNLLRIISHAEYFSSFNWLICSDLHMKVTLFEYIDDTVGIVSGRNLTDSNWDDFSVMVEGSHCEDLITYINTLKNKSRPINEDTFTRILEEQQISESGLKAVIEA